MFSDQPVRSRHLARGALEDRRCAALYPGQVSIGVQFRQQQHAPMGTEKLMRVEIVFAGPGTIRSLSSQDCRDWALSAHFQGSGLRFGSLHIEPE